MEKIQYKTLKIVFNNNESFEDFILQSNEVCIYQKQLCQLTAAIYENLTDLSPEVIKPFSIGQRNGPYNLRNGHILSLPSARTTCYATNSILFRACQVWNKLPLVILTGKFAFNHIVCFVEPTLNEVFIII